MSDKIPIELKPYTALQILSFLDEFKIELSEHEKGISLLECFKEFSDEVYLKITDNQIEDAKMDRTINRALGYEPN